MTRSARDIRCGRSMGITSSTLSMAMAISSVASSQSMPIM